MPRCHDKLWTITYLWVVGQGIWANRISTELREKHIHPTEVRDSKNDLNQDTYWPLISSQECWDRYGVQSQERWVRPPQNELHYKTDHQKRSKGTSNKSWNLLVAYAVMQPPIEWPKTNFFRPENQFFVKTDGLPGYCEEDSLTNWTRSPITPSMLSI